MFVVEDWAGILNPGFMVKGDSKLGRALMVVKVNKNSWVTQDGRVWNARRVVKCKREMTRGVEMKQMEENQSVLRMNRSNVNAPNNLEERIPTRMACQGRNIDDEGSESNTDGSLCAESVASRVKEKSRIGHPPVKLNYYI